MTTSNRLGITELAETQNNRSVTVNEAIAKLEAGAMSFPAVSIGDTAPPGSPAEGDLYVLGASPTGAWSGQGKHVAVYYNSAWFFLPPIEGAFAYAQDDNAYYFYNGSAWALFAGGGGSGDVVGPGSAVDSNIALFNTTTGKLIKDSGVAISTDGTFAANSDAKIATEKGVKTYVDGKVTGLSWKQAVRAATTANGTLASAFANGSTIDGVTLATGDRILLKNQTTGTENGIYVVAASGAPTRATDADAGAELVDASVYVSEGTTLADTQWTCTTNAPITPGSTSLAFAQAGIGGFTAASTTEALTGTDTSKGVTPDALAALWEKGADVASATTISLGEGGLFHITGTTTITDIDWATAKDGRTAILIFDAALILTHNATTLKLPGGANITTAAGDRAIFVQDSGDNVICAAYIRADGTALVGGGVTTARTITAGTGLTGGGDLSADRTFNVDIGKQSAWVPAAAMTPRTTNGAAPGTVEMSTYKNMLRTLDFDASTQEFAQFDIRMPKSWNEGTVTFIPVWSHAATTTNFGVVWGMDAVSFSDNEAMDATFGGEQTSTDTGGTTNNSYQGPESSAITIAGSPATGDLVMFRVHRNPSDGSDTMAIDARLHGVLLLYTIDALKDN